MAFFKNWLPERKIDINSIKIVAFDKDNTITPANCEIEDNMAKKIISLIKNRYVVILTARDINVCKNHIISWIQKNFGENQKQHLDRIILGCSNGSQIYTFNKNTWDYELVSQLEWKLVDEKNFKKAVSIVANELNLDEEKMYFEIRSETMAVIACIPREAPKEERKNFDPTMEKRKLAIEKIRHLFPEGYELIAGGSTSIDIGLYDKKSGMEHLIKYFFKKFNHTNKEVVFFGDNFDGGNDAPVENVKDIYIVKVKNPDETEEILTKNFGV